MVRASFHAHWTAGVPTALEPPRATEQCDFNHSRVARRSWRSTSTSASSAAYRSCSVLSGRVGLALAVATATASRRTATWASAGTLRAAAAAFGECDVEIQGDG